MIQRIYPYRSADIARRALVTKNIGTTWNSYRRPFTVQSIPFTVSNVAGGVTTIPVTFNQVFSTYNMYVIDRIGIVQANSVGPDSLLEYRASISSKYLSDSYLPVQLFAPPVGITTLGWLAKLPEKMVLYAHDSLSFDVRTITAGGSAAIVSVQLHGQLLASSGANSAQLYQRMARRREILRPYTVTMRDQAISLAAGATQDVLVTPPDEYACIQSMYFYQDGAASSAAITASISSPNSRFQMMNSPMPLMGIPTNIQDEYKFPEPFWLTPSSRMVVRLSSTDVNACKVWMAMRGALVRKEHIAEGMRMIEEGDGL